MVVSMLKTEEESYLVHSIQKTHIWLEVLEGVDMGMRLSVPRYSSNYSDKLEQKVNNLSEGDVRKFVLVSEDAEDPDWYIKTIIDEQQS